MSATRNLITIRGGAAAALLKQIGHFALHFFEMCAPMCIGFALGDLVYFALAGLAGYSEPFAELPVLSVLVVTFSMTAPMTAWMLYRGMPQRAVIEMSAAMPIVAIVLLGLGWFGIVPMDSLALLEHALVMPAMLIPMLLRLDVYAGRRAFRGESSHARRRRLAGLRDRRRHA
jgi:hypothetical protein